MSILEYRNRSQQVIIHLLFWFIYLSFFTFLTWVNAKIPYHVIWFRGLVFVPIDIAATYITIYLLLPRFLIKKRYLIFTLCFSALAVCVIFLNQVISYFIYIPLFLKKVSPYGFFHFSLWLNLVSTYAVVILAAGIRIGKLWLKEQQAIARLETAQAESELSLLKYQMNPHFIYNTLNNIDSLIHSDKEKASKSLIRLSEIMRYVAYDSSANTVTIRDEVNYLNSFIELQKLRFGDDLIRVDLSITNPLRRIAPMLFIPLVENAIKHGEKSKTKPAVVISLVAENDITFTVTNTIGSEKINKDKTGGIGLRNLRRRLELIYPGNYSLECGSTDNKTFKARLWIR